MRSLFCLLLVSLAACGQKGALYLPVEAPAEVPEQVQAPDAETTPADEKKKDGNGNPGR